MHWIHVLLEIFISWRWAGLVYNNGWRVHLLSCGNAICDNICTCSIMQLVFEIDARLNLTFFVAQKNNSCDKVFVQTSLQC